MKKRLTTLLLLLAIALTAGCPQGADLVNVSYDPTREFYREFNAAFTAYYKEKTGETKRVRTAHGGSSAKARAVIDGLQTDVVTLALAFDIDHIAQRGLLSLDWQQRLPYNSSPYYSTVVFLVRKDNPRNITDWSDLIRPDIRVVVAHPKTSGVARWAYLAGWGSVLKRELGDDWVNRLHDPDAAEEVAAAQRQAQEFITTLYRNVAVLPRGARDASQAFIQQRQGDVLLDWENQAKLTLAEFPGRGYEIVMPSISILAEPPVAVVDRNVDRRGTRELAEAYLLFLYSEVGQEIIARHHYRPRNESVMERFRGNFAEIELFTIDDVFGGWHEAQEKHFSNGGIFDQIYVPGGR
jgi:sulfate transport system substrate-binding protein